MKKSVKLLVISLISLSLLLGFIFAAHTITTSSGGTSFSVDEDTANLFNITVNNTDSGAEANITSVNITLPSGAVCTFVDASNGTSIGSNNTPVADTFTNASNSLIWTNTTGYVINGSEYKYFWFNASCTEPGTYNITVYTTNVTGVYSSNLSLEVNDTSPFNLTACGTLSNSGTYLLDRNINSSGTCLTITANNVLVNCQGYLINFSESITHQNAIYSYGYDNLTIKNCVINQGNLSTISNSGISFYSSENSTVYNNTITIFNGSDVVANGVFVQTSPGVNISFNSVNISGSGLMYGIVLYPGSNDSIIHGNNITSYSSASLSVSLILGLTPASNYVYRSNVTNNRLIADGSVANGGLAISVVGLGNLIYNNYFNSPNSSFAGMTSSTPWYSYENLTNSLNTSKTAGTNIIGRNYLGGNYWTNPTSSGYSDYCTNLDSDYICDSSYTLDSGNIDYFPLTNHTNTTSSSGSSSSSSSSGGNTIKTFWKFTHAISDEQFQKGYSKQIYERERIRVNISGGYYYIGIVDLTDTTATINVSSGPIQIILSVEQDASFDIDNDNIYDIYVILNLIENGKANITIRKINEAKESDEEGAVKTEGEVVDNGENIVGDYKNSSWIYWVIEIIVVLIFAWFVLNKKEKRKSK